MDEVSLKQEIPKTLVRKRTPKRMEESGRVRGTTEVESGEICDETGRFRSLVERRQT